MTMSRGSVLSVSAAGGLLAALGGCRGASSGPATPAGMPEYPPPPGHTPKPAATAATATADAAKADDLEKLVNDALHPRKNCCAGKNACKGQGGCKTARNACKGQNSCKGLGGCQPAGGCR